MDLIINCPSALSEPYICSQNPYFDLILILALLISFLFTVPDTYHWFFDEVNEEKEYEEAYNEYNAKMVLNTPATEPEFGALTLAENTEYVRVDDVLHDCITDPSLCEETGFTISMWLKRKGNSSPAPSLISYKSPGRIYSALIPYSLLALYNL